MLLPTFKFGSCAATTRVRSTARAKRLLVPRQSTEHALVSMAGATTAVATANGLSGSGIRQPSVEEVLAPLGIRVSHQAHDVAAGMEIERTRLAQQLHVGLMSQLVPFATVAVVAACNEVLPSGESAARTGHYVVERELAGRHHLAAVLAGVAIAQQDVLARESAGLMRDPAVFEQTDHRGHADGEARGMQEVAVLFLGASHSLEHQHDSAARGTHVDGLIRRIEHQHRRQHGRARAGLDCYDKRLRRLLSGSDTTMWTSPESPHIPPYAS